MMLLFSSSGLSRLDEIVHPGVLCVFDFDGTLAPIVTQPDQASLPADIRHRLIELSRHATVGVITGRSVTDIRARMNFDPHFLIGNHGLEGVPGWEERGTRSRELCRTWKDTITAALQDRSRFDPQIWVEDKIFTLSVHYRLAHSIEMAERELSALLAGLTPAARVIAGKRVFSLLPHDSVGKGDALEKLMEIHGSSAAIFVGDDVTDEDVFRLQRRDVLSVRVEHSAQSFAEFYLPHGLDMVRLLDEIIARLGAGYMSPVAAASQTT